MRNFIARTLHMMCRLLREMYLKWSRKRRLCNAKQRSTTLCIVPDWPSSAPSQAEGRWLARWELCGSALLSGPASSASNAKCNTTTIGGARVLRRHDACQSVRHHVATYARAMAQRSIWRLLVCCAPFYIDMTIGNKSAVTVPCCAIEALSGF